MYKLLESPNEVRRVSDGMLIPKGSRFWSQYEAWLVKGNVPLPLDPDIETLRQLSESDGGMPRVIEDVLALLESKGILLEAELPQSSRDKLVNRRNLRSQLRG